VGLEIERKFLVLSDAWRAGVERSTPIRQAYVSRSPLLSARIRVFGEQGFVTLKSDPGTLVRQEFEYEIPKSDALDIIAHFALEPPIAKTRHSVPHHGSLWTIDVFEGANMGLVMAEIELENEQQAVSLPAWAGVEVTYDPRYGNSNLACHPFSTWADAE
jgi:adenylate cyclase